MSRRTRGASRCREDRASRVEGRSRSRPLGRAASCGARRAPQHFQAPHSELFSQKGHQTSPSERFQLPLPYGPRYPSGFASSRSSSTRSGPSLAPRIPRRFTPAAVLTFTRRGHTEEDVVDDFCVVVDREAGPLATFFTRSQATATMLELLDDEPDWLGDVVLERFRLVVAEPSQR